MYVRVQLMIIFLLLKFEFPNFNNELTLIEINMCIADSDRITKYSTFSHFALETLKIKSSERKNARTYRIAHSRISTLVCGVLTRISDETIAASRENTVCRGGITLARPFDQDTLPRSAKSPSAPRSFGAHARARTHRRRRVAEYSRARQRDTSTP